MSDPYRTPAEMPPPSKKPKWKTAWYDSPITAILFNALLLGSCAVKLHSEIVKTDNMRQRQESIEQACEKQPDGDACLTECTAIFYKNNLPCSCYREQRTKNVPVRCLEHFSKGDSNVQAQ